MRTIKREFKVYKYHELTEEQQEKVLDNNYDINVDYEWWMDSVYIDADDVGIKITAFDIDRGQMVDAEFTEDACFTAHKIVDNHGDECGTFKIAEAFLQERDRTVDEAERDEDGEVLEYELDQKLDEVEREFLYDIKHEYLDMLRREYEYLTSKEAIEETIDCNDYEFTEDGKIY